MTVPWGRITPNDFEDLALEYARSEFPHHNWIATPRSGDGNRDAEAATSDWVLNRIVEYQHWLEAKFHHKSGAPKRSQLDPTLVSGLIDPSVRAILFVTNGRIPDSYMIRAERAFTRPPDRFVEFKEGPDLARWLSHNDAISLRYFGAQVSEKAITGARPIEISTLTILDVGDYRRALYKPVSHLVFGREYLLHLILRSLEACDLDITLPENSPIILTEASGQARIRVSPGTSSRCLRVTPRQVGIFADCAITLSSTNVSASKVLQKRLTIREDPNLKVIFTAQAKIASEIKQLLRSLRQGANAICCLYGAGGVGKTHLLDSLEAELDLRTDFLRVTFSGQRSEDARLLCRLLLFLHFGPSGLDLRVLDHSLIAATHQMLFFGSHLLERLLRAVSDSAEARSLVTDLIENRDIRPVGSPVVDPQPASSPVVVVADDSHKLHGSEASLLARMLHDHFNGKHNSMILLSARPHEFRSHTLQKSIAECAIYSSELSAPSAGEICDSVQLLLNRSCPQSFSVALGSMEFTTLNIVNLLSDLRTREQKLTDPGLIQALDQWSKTARVGKDKVVLERITRSHQLFPLLDVVHAVRIGVPLEPLIAKFGSSEVNKAASRELLRLNPDQLAVPFHDLVYEAYLEFRHNCHTEQVGTFLSESLDEQTLEPDRALPALLRCGPSFEKRYLAAALAYRDSLINIGRFGPALDAAKSIVKVFEQRLTEQTDKKKELAEAWFVYADCLDHCSTGDESRHYFEKARGTLATKWSDPCGNGVHFEAEAELFNLKYWDLEVDQLPDLEQFVTRLGRIIKEVPEVLNERRFARAYLTSLNRLMMFYLLLDVPSDLLSRNLRESGELGMENYVGFALIDHAKGTYHKDVEHSARELREGNQIFYRLGSEHRRLLTSQAELAFIECRLGLAKIASLASAGRILLEEGLWPEYLNSRLKCVALSLTMGNLELASALLTEFYQRRSGAEDDTRRVFLTANIEACLAFVRGNDQAALDWSLEHQKGVSILGKSYQSVARQNISTCKKAPRGQRTVGWYQLGLKPPAGQFLLEPRIW